jgi:intracellular multiplication protein IcmJ
MQSSQTSMEADQVRRLLPLALTSSPTTWTASMEATGPTAVCEATQARDAGVCRFCGDTQPVAPGPYHLDDDHTRWSADNLATACLLCHSAQHLGRVTADEEVLLIWVPDGISQAAINRTVRAIHTVFEAHGQPLHLGAAPTVDTPRLRAAYRSYQALADLSQEAIALVKTSSVQAFCASLIDAPARAADLSNLRLLHRGRFYRRGVDVYPQLLAAASPKA